ncbi:glucosyltransferase domain-containing protein [Treponema sp.]|uniref:glucosyltransferase domain-containing protein n=1 Tax=Treponema sp. TaxID=166 RepID=UPI00388D9F09
MKNFIKTKSQLFATIIFAFLLIFCVLITITKIDNIILKHVEVFFHKTLRNPARWIDVLQNSARLFGCTFALIYFLCFIEKGKALCTNIKKTLFDCNGILFSKRSSYFFAGTVFFLLFAYSNVILANYFYADDVFRNYGGNRSWIGFSRYISEFGSILIHNSLKLNDIAPLTQIIAIVISSATVLILSVSLTETVSVKNILVLSVIFISPFYAENISYRFDSPYMALSLFFSAVPFLFRKDTKSFVFTSIICLILTCISYQAALPLYILAAIFIFLNDFINSKELKDNLFFAAKSVISFVAALVIFKFLFMNKMSNGADDYFSTRIMISALLPNVIQYVKTTFSLNGGFLTKIFFILSIIAAIFNAVKISKQNKIITFFVSAVLIVVSYVLSFGPYLVFERPAFTSRAFMGFNVFVSFILLGSIQSSINVKPVLNLTSRIIAFLYVYSCVVFMFTYGNCLKNQKEYENFRLSMILHDLSEFTIDESKPNVSFEGGMDLCQKSHIAMKNYPLLKQIVPRMPGSSSTWNKELLSACNFECTDEYTQKDESFELIKKCSYHEIYQNGNNFIVVLK